MEGRYACMLMTGSMNPVHCGHVQMLLLARQRLEEQGYEIIRATISPSHDAWMKHKQHGLIPFQHRLAMLQLAVAQYPWMHVSSWEGQQVEAIDFPEVCEHLRWSILEELAGSDTNLSSRAIEFFYVCGADLATTCRLYTRPPSQNTKAVIVQRVGTSIPLPPATSASALIVCKTNVENLNSTALRQHLREEDYAAIAPLVPAPVLAYLTSFRTALLQPVQHPEDIGRFIDYLNAASIRVVVFDMDQTLMQLHSHARATYENVHELIASVTEDFKRVAPVLLHEGFGLAIATHSDEMEVFRFAEAERGNHLLGESLARYILKACMPHIADNFFLIGYNPSYRRDNNPDHIGKNLHVQRICEHFQVNPSQVILYDDDELNVATARGFIAQKVDPVRGFVIADFLHVVQHQHH